MENLIKKYEKSLEILAKAEIKSEVIKAKIDEYYKNTEISCSCGEAIKLRDIELIHEFYGGYRPCGEDDWEYRERYIWICKKCALGWFPVEDLGKYAESFNSYVKCIYKWYSVDNSPGGKVEIILKPFLKKKEEEREKIRKQTEINLAKRKIQDLLKSGEITLAEIKDELK